MTTKHQSEYTAHDIEREEQAKRWVLESDEIDFTEARRDEMVEWIRQSAENCDAYLRYVREFRWDTDRTGSVIAEESARAEQTALSPRHALLAIQFGATLATLRADRRLSVEELAASSGVPSEDIVRFEAGEDMPILSVFALAKGLDVPMERFVSDLKDVGTVVPGTDSKGDH